jgi:hypothetical protein
MGKRQVATRTASTALLAGAVPRRLSLPARYCARPRRACRSDRQSESVQRQAIRNYRTRLSYMRLGALLILAAPIAFAEDAAGIMARVAANVEQAVEARRQYVYQQTVRASLIKTNGQLSRRERRQYTVVPSPTGTEKKLVSLKGEYRKGKQSLTYTASGGDDRDDGIEAALLRELTDGLVDDKQSRDGIPPELFPLRSRDLAAYAFTGKGEFEFQGRRTYRIAFEPVHMDCYSHTGTENEGEKEGCVDGPWVGEA